MFRFFVTGEWVPVQAYCPSWRWVMFRLFATVTGEWVTVFRLIATVTGGWVTVQTPLIAPLGDG
jgi:hypothetical protein